MAFENEKQELLVSVEKNRRGDTIKVSKVTNTATGSVSVDIRQFYLDDNDKDTPTKKGIRINTEMLGDILYSAATTMEIDEIETLIVQLTSYVESGDAGDEVEEEDSEV